MIVDEKEYVIDWRNDSTIKRTPGGLKKKDGKLSDKSGNFYKEFDNFIIVKLSGKNNGEMVIDKESLKIIEKTTISQTETGYARSSKSRSLHRFIAECDNSNKIVHHINGIKLDNRKENLEIVSNSAHGKEHKNDVRKTQQFKNIEIKVDNCTYQLNWTNSNLVRNTKIDIMTNAVDKSQHKGNYYISFETFVVLLPTNDYNYPFIISKDTFDKVGLHTWRNHGGYIETSIKNKKIYLHRFLAKPLKDEVVDHINRIRWDNRTCNLQAVNYSANSQNRTTDNHSKGIKIFQENRIQVTFSHNGKCTRRIYSNIEKATIASQHLTKYFYPNNPDNSTSLVVDKAIIEEFFEGSQEGGRSQLPQSNVSGIFYNATKCRWQMNIFFKNVYYKNFMSNKSLIILIKCFYFLTEVNEEIKKNYSFNIVSSLTDVIERKLDSLPINFSSISQFIDQYDITNLIKTENQKILFNIKEKTFSIKGIRYNKKKGFWSVNFTLNKIRYNELFNNKSLCVVLKFFYTIIQKNEELKKRSDFDLKKSLLDAIELKLDIMPEECLSIDDFIDNYDITGFVKTARQKELFNNVNNV